MTKARALIFAVALFGCVGLVALYRSAEPKLQLAASTTIDPYGQQEASAIS